MPGHAVIKCPRRSPVVIPSTPALPLLATTRFNAAIRLPRDTTRSIKLLPERSSSWAPSTLPDFDDADGDSPRWVVGSPAEAGIAGALSSRTMTDSLSCPFGPSSTRDGTKSTSSLLRPLLTSLAVEVGPDVALSGAGRDLPE